MTERSHSGSASGPGMHAEVEAVAATLRRGLRPGALPPLAEGEVRAAYRSSGNGPGGDWYDVIELDGGRVALAVGDVAGRGPEAAALMVGLRHSARALALEGLPPAAVAERLDRLFEGEFATFLFALCDPASGTVRFANAGHLPPLVIAPDGTTRFIAARASVPLGAGFSTPFGEGVADFPAGSTLLLYTDGLVERRGQPVEIGLARLQREVTGLYPDPDLLCGRLADDLLGEGAEDDAVLLLFRSHARAERETFRLPVDPSALSRARARIRAWLGGVGAEPDECHDLLVAAAEACANAIEHSGATDDVEVELAEQRAGRIQVSVRDVGRWDEAGSDPDRGRGLLLVEALTDELEVTPSPEGTTVRFRRVLRRARGLQPAMPVAGAAAPPAAHERA